MNDKGSIAGRVVDAAGRPVSGVTITISSSTQPTSDLATLTNADGRFRLSGLAPGPYGLSAHRRGQPVGEAEAEVRPGQPAEVEIRLHE
ncbi:carboxypeptidase-like regulatory domain-containing protein [Desulfococcus multivorans]|uniref:Carboxypeptidase regulatory-like domain-containing protein n=1 Tax=Desulfococcus multivorans DSM 2059 TaxID=1121405 RepID=S7TGQ7_DESML|nr:carboxypeptidase-like regulatory domain-containing protein [Desulfococcus multivorans]AOY59979.1 uncharacterized protein Dmul_32090 [Desulfococcus multivorans]EPR35976.1 hypothetical protein dsmv_0681 [Desulfococcus multivorans DSM 2059]SJZ36106.1 Carboxypeptidase regulatory-like domain-containing protein [Desulfococcus multivorans DSM 2059]